MTRERPEGPSGHPGSLALHAEVTLTFDDPRSCEEARAALLPESEGFLEIEAEGHRLRLRVPRGSPTRVLSTLDDTISCLQAAESSRRASKEKDDKDA